jgi:hypothetical protein
LLLDVAIGRLDGACVWLSSQAVLSSFLVLGLYVSAATGSQILGCCILQFVSHYICGLLEPGMFDGTVPEIAKRVGVTTLKMIVGIVCFLVAVTATNDTGKNECNDLTGHL